MTALYWSDVRAKLCISKYDSRTNSVTISEVIIRIINDETSAFSIFVCKMFAFH